MGVDCPDQVVKPDLTTAQRVTWRREDYFGRGANNAAFVLSLLGNPGGTGSNSGRFGTLVLPTTPRGVFPEVKIVRCLLHARRLSTYLDDSPIT